MESPRSKSSSFMMISHAHVRRGLVPSSIVRAKEVVSRAIEMTRTCYVLLRRPIFDEDDFRRMIIRVDRVERPQIRPSPENEPTKSIRPLSYNTMVGSRPSAPRGHHPPLQTVSTVRSWSRPDVIVKLAFRPLDEIETRDVSRMWNTLHIFVVASNAHVIESPLFKCP